MARRSLHVGLLSLALVLPACSTFGAPEGGTEEGRRISDLWAVFFVAGLAVASIVIGLILWSVIRYRKRGDELPPQFRLHVPVEITYIVIPVVIVAFLFALTFDTEVDVERLARDPDVTVDVRGFTWSWRFDYRDQGVTVIGTPQQPPELVLPVGRTVRIVLTSGDVIHAFYVPGFLFKRDAIPGRVTEFDLVPQEEGEFRGFCAEFCGLDHARMTFTLRTVSPEEFEAWLEASRAAEGSP